jgi:pilus assembly protein CpaB
MNKRLILVLAGAAFFGLIAALMVMRYLSNAQGRSNVRVVVAKANVPVGTKLAAEQLTAVDFPSNSLPEGYFTKIGDLQDRVTITNLVAREPITETKIAAVGAAGGLTAVIPAGYRAMTVNVDDVVGLSGFVQPGSFVDVVVVIKMTNNNPVSKIVLQKIKVLASGQSIDRPQNEREPTKVKTVTLQVTPEEAEKLALASTEGKLRLVMRNSGDNNQETTPGVTTGSLLSGTSAPLSLPDTRPAAPPQQPAAAPPAPVARASNPLPPPPPIMMRREPAPVKPAPVAAPPPPAPPRNTVEVIEGVKRRSVDLP